MSCVEFLPLAKVDLIDIWYYIASDNVVAADKFLESLEKLTDMLAQHPYVGRERKEFSRALRSIPHGRYMVFYRPVEGGVEILRVLSAARDIGEEYFH